MCKRFTVADCFGHVHGVGVRLDEAQKWARMYRHEGTQRAGDGLGADLTLATMPVGAVWRSHADDRGITIRRVTSR